MMDFLFSWIIGRIGGALQSVSNQVQNMIETAPNSNTLNTTTDTFTVSGTIDTFTLTVTSGNEANLIPSATDQNGTAIAMVLQDGSDFQFITVVEATGASVELAEPLQATVTGATLHSRHDSALGQHYTDAGYRAWADRLLTPIRQYGDLFLRLAQDAASGDWATYGGASAIAYNHNKNPPQANTGLWSQATNKTTRVTFTGSGVGGVRQTIDVTGFVGTLSVEAAILDHPTVPIGTDTEGTIRIIDASGPSTLGEATFRRQVSRHEFEISGLTSITLEIEKSDSGSSSRNFHIGDIRFNSNQDQQVLSPGDRVALFGDSWLDETQFTGFKAQLEAKGLSVIDSIQYEYPGDGFDSAVKTGAGGATSKYGVDWVDIWLNSIRPRGVVINYFTNDHNNQGANTYANIGVRAPDGTDTTLLSMGVDDAARLAAWEAALTTIATACTLRGIKVFVMGPAVTGSFSQSVGHGEWSKEITGDLSPSA